MLDLRLIEESEEQKKEKKHPSFLTHLSENSQEALYSSAYCSYQKARYEEAMSLFRLLVTIDPYEKKYWMGLGASSQMHKDYAASLRAYAVSVVLDADDPYPHIHATESYLALNNLEEALKALDMAEERFNSSNVQDPQIKERLSLVKNICANIHNKKG